MHPFFIITAIIPALLFIGIMSSFSPSAVKRNEFFAEEIIASSTLITKPSVQTTSVTTTYKYNNVVYCLVNDESETANVMAVKSCDTSATGEIEILDSVNGEAVQKYVRMLLKCGITLIR